MAAVVINAGKQLITSAIVAQGTLKYIQWGAGAGTAAVADTGLFATTGTTEARTAGTLTQVAGTQTLGKMQVVGTVTSLGTPTITNVGIFDAAGAGGPPTGGNCFFHADHASTVMAIGDSIAYTLTVDFTP